MTTERLMFRLKLALHINSARAKPMTFTLWRGIVGMRLLLNALRVALVAGALACRSFPAKAQSQVAVLIGTTPGGGYDVYARVLARHIGRNLPGQPAVIAKNVPSAGGLPLPNFMDHHP